VAPTMPLSWAVKQALGLPEDALHEPVESPRLADLLKESIHDSPRPGWVDLFYVDGAPLPCWEESHTTLYGDWLTRDDTYPVYYVLFRKLTAMKLRTKLLEIGVFTGYVGAVFARAAQGPAFYVGVDPNLYTSYGLVLAGKTFKTLRVKLANFDFCLMEGYSWDTHVRNSLIYTAPFDIVHVDGDHTLPGKLMDLELARQVVGLDGLVLVDDYEHHDCVRDAIRRAMAMGWFKEFLLVPTHRGLAVLRA